jgi:hypothetical protein
MKMASPITTTQDEIKTTDTNNSSSQTNNSTIPTPAAFLELFDPTIERLREFPSFPIIIIISITLQKAFLNTDFSIQYSQSVPKIIQLSSHETKIGRMKNAVDMYGRLKIQIIQN